jgi:hypothetical protein
MPDPGVAKRAPEGRASGVPWSGTLSRSRTLANQSGGMQSLASLAGLPTTLKQG